MSTEKSESTKSTDDSKVKKAVKLRAADKKDIFKLLDSKCQQVIKALGNEISADTGVIRIRLLNDRGFQFTSQQLRAQLENLAAKKRELINDVDSDEQVANTTTQENDIEDEFSARLVELSAEYERRKQEVTRWKNESKEAILTEKKERLKDLIQSREDRIQALISEKSPFVFEEIERITKELEKVKNVEFEVDIDARKRSELVRQAQSRLQYIVRDAALSAQSELMSIEDRDEALLLLDRIPSVAEVISIIESPDGGVNSLVNRMKPKFLIGLPAPQETSPSPSKQVEETQEVELEAVVVSVVSDD